MGFATARCSTQWNKSDGPKTQSLSPLINLPMHMSVAETSRLARLHFTSYKTVAGQGGDAGKTPRTLSKFFANSTPNIEGGTVYKLMPLPCNRQNAKRQ